MRASTALFLSAVVVLSGCSSDEKKDETPVDAENPTTPLGATGIGWYKDVLPIVQTRCQGCHSEGGIAPFELRSYADAASRRDAIALAVASGRMPPWMPSDDCEPLKHSRRLSAAELETFAQWNQDGAPAGNPADAPAASGGPTQLPRVDAELKPSAAYSPNAQLDDDYRCFILDPALTVDCYVTGLDIVPGVRNQVHHVILYATDFAQAQANDAAEAGLGWTCFGGPGTQREDLVGGWVPGSEAIQYPVNTGIRVSAGSALVMQIHYNLSQGSEPDLTTAKLQYSPTPVAKPANILPLADLNLVIPPQSADVSTTVSVTVPTGYSGTIWGVIPHMHTRGQRITVKQNDACLIDIPQWDFHWQQSYLFAAANGLPFVPGDTLTLRCEWDNPTDKEVRWGEGTDDEMCLNYLYLTQ